MPIRVTIPHEPPAKGRHMGRGCLTDSTSRQLIYRTPSDHRSQSSQGEAGAWTRSQAKHFPGARRERHASLLEQARGAHGPSRHLGRTNNGLPLGGHTGTMMPLSTCASSVYRCPHTSRTPCTIRKGPPEEARSRLSQPGQGDEDHDPGATAPVTASRSTARRFAGG